MLEEYRRKRDFARTTEPALGGTARGIFVVQKHDARRLHYDFRLELNGVLRSWAVPRGPSMVPSEKRLAIETEDHPIAYADFEGSIPEGNYGAGNVIVWDRGNWRPLSDNPRGDLAKGHLSFELEGHKLRGKFALTRTSMGWLLVKAQDKYALPSDSFGEQSILTGRDLSEVAHA